MKRKRWQLWLILIVIALTIYNILPTVFFYSKPLKSPIDKSKAEEISVDIMNRVNSLESDSISWLNSFCKMLKVKPKYIEINKENSSQIDIEFTKLEDAKKFKKFISRAGNLISFVPAQLSISQNQIQSDTKKITIQRQIPIQFDTKKADDFFEYTSKIDKNGNIASFYREITFDRASEIGSSVAGVSDAAVLVENILKSPRSA